MGFKSEPTSAVATSRLSILQALIVDHRPSLIALQESAAVSRLRSRLGAAYQIESGPIGLVTAFAKTAWTRTGRDDALTRGFAVVLDHARGTRLRIWNVHGRALHASDDQKRGFFRRDLRRALERTRAADPDREEIIAGDFNLPPFDPAIVLEDGLRANRCLTWAEDHHDTSIDRPLFNPSWQLFGEVTAPHGTYYRSRVDSDGPWSVLDQALLTTPLARQGCVFRRT